MFDEEQAPPTPEERVARVNAIREAVKKGHVGMLLDQRDFWRQATIDVLSELDGLGGIAPELAVIARVMMEQTAKAADALDAWLAKHEGERDAHLINEARELIKGKQ